MQKYDIHVCLVSDQAAANLLPVAVPEFKPKKAIFLVTNTMKKNGKADNLKKAFHSLDIAVQEYELSAPFDFEITENEILDILENYNGTPFSELDIALNVTGGTKVMAMAAQSIFSLIGKPVFYVNTEKKTVLFLSKHKDNNFEMKAELITLRSYFTSYSFDIQSFSKKYNTQITPIFVDFFIKNYSRNGNIIPIINAFSAKAKNHRYNFNEKDANFRSLNQFLYDVSDTGFIEYTDKYINFQSEENEKFIGGTWLEHYVYQQLRDCEQIDDIAMSVKYSHPDFDKDKKEFAKENQGKQNELDLAFIANNKLHIIECKTVKMNENGKEEKDNDILYKLETLRNKMGIMTKGCLVSYLPVSTAVRNRAEAYNVEIIDGIKGIQSLRKRIEDWIKEKE